MRTYIARRADLYSFVLRPILVSPLTNIGSFITLSEKFFLSAAGCFCVVGLSRCVLWGMGSSVVGQITLR